MATGGVRRRVMVVDDDPGYLQALCDLFARRDPGFDVEVRVDVGAALGSLFTQPADLVLMDRYLPGMDGIELCRRLRARLPWMTVVISSGHVTPDLRWEALRAGASRVLPKPVTPERVHAALVEALRAAASARSSLISSHVELAHAIASSSSRRYGTLISSDEIETLALLGLCEAAARFDPFRDEAFAAFASWRIRGAIVDGLRRTTSQTRARYARRRRCSEVRRMLAAGGNVAPERIAAHLGLTLDDVTEAEAPNRVTFQPLASEPADAGPAPDEIVAHRELLEVIRAARARLPELEAYILTAHYDRGVSLPEISRTMGLGQRRVEQAHSRALATLRRIAERGRAGAE